MAKAIAIAVVQENPFKAALDSAHNSLKWLGDLMYGTEERTKMTYAFAIGLAVLGYALQASELAAMQVCPL